MARPFVAVLLAANALIAGCATSSDPTGTPPVAVSSVVVSPGSANLVLTGTTTAQFTAVARDAAGVDLAGRAIAWASGTPSVATVTSAGLVTAVSAGSTNITATSEGVVGSATVNVAAGGGGGGGGATVLLQEGFEDSNWASRGWYATGVLTTTTAEKFSGNSSLVGTFGLGAQTAPWNGARASFTPTSSFYLRYRVKYSANWIGAAGDNAHPHEFFFLTTENTLNVGPAFTRLTVYVEHNYQNDGGRPIIGWQDGQNIDQSRPNQNLVGTTETRSVAGCNGNPDGIPSACYTVGAQYWNWKELRAASPRFMPNSGTGYKNDWHLVEAYVQLNTIVGGVAQNNGIARYWFDGQLVMEATNAQFRTGAHPNMLFNQMLLGPYIGNGSTVVQTVWFDDIYVATARP